MNLATKYIKEVMTEKIIVSSYIRKAVERHLKDLQEADAKGLYFDEDYALQIIRLFQIIPHSKGRWSGRGFTLQGWQAFILWVVYGWKWKKTKTRRFNKVYVKVARKNGKTEFLAGVGVIGLTIDRVPGGEIYWAATKFAQANVGWERQKTMIELLMSRHSSFKDFGTNSKRIYNKKSKMFVRALGKDSKREDGLSPYYAFIDEYHAHETTGLVDILESGMGAYLQPMTWIITTAGFDAFCVCKTFEDRCKAILDGHAENDEVFAAIFELDEADDWQNPKNWIKANPSLGATNTLKAMKSEFQKAKLEGITKEISFRVKNLNQWHNQKETWIPADIWQMNASKMEENMLKGRKCYAGFDLGPVKDATALSLCFPFPEHDFIYFKHYFFCPEATADIRSLDSNVNYNQWARDGDLILTSGNIVDHDAIFKVVVQCSEDYDLVVMAYDPYNKTFPIIIQLSDYGINCRSFSQGIKHISAPAKRMETLLHEGNWRHDDNKMMAWMVSNVFIKTDANDNIKPMKDKKEKKIDGVISDIMAYGAYEILKAEPKNELPKDFEIMVI